MQFFAECTVRKILGQFREDFQMLLGRLLGNEQNEEQIDRAAIR